MGKCAACGYAHPHPGDKSCKYSNEAREKCKSAGEPETKWQEFLDIDTLEQIAKSELSKHGTYLTSDDLKLLRQADEDQKNQLRKLQHDMADISSKLGSLLTLHAPPAHTPVPTPSVVTGVTPVTTTTTSASVTTTTISSSAMGTIPTGAIGLPPISSTLGIPSSAYAMTSTGASLGYSPGAGGLTWSSPPPPFPPGPGVTPTSGYYLPTHLRATPPTTTPTPPAPASSVPAAYLSSPLTAALQNLVDNDMGQQPGTKFRPEFYVLHKQEGEPLKSVSYKSMSYRKLIHGMVLVARNIVSQGGDINSYLGHMEYLTRHGKNGDYTDQAYVECDKIVIDNYVQNPSAGIKVGDVKASSFCFHDVTRVKNQNLVSLSGNKKKKKIRNRQSIWCRKTTLPRIASIGTIRLV